jgi:hypothetical protein
MDTRGKREPFQCYARKLTKASLLALLCIALPIPLARAREGRVNFSGEVSQGQTFRKSIGHGLEFLLVPDTMQPGVITGWTIEVAPHGTPPEPQCRDFVWVATPPYRFQNARYLDTSYGATAQEAVRASPREFSFVLNCADFKVERNRVDLVLWPSSHSKQEVEKARAKLGSSPVGKGRLWIEEYRITPGRKSAAVLELGKIKWIKFKVDITFPARSPRRPNP